MKKSILIGIVSLLSYNFTMAQSQKAVITTTQGDIELIFYDNTPLHRDNFIKLAKDGFYDSLLFHRVIPEFMIQGGDPDSKNAKPGTPLGGGSIGDRVPAEFRPELYHRKGALAAARDNNPEKASSSCQFYIVVGKTLTDAELDNLESRTGVKYPVEHRQVYKTEGGTPFLDQGYTVYGQVIRGIDVVEKIVVAKRNQMDRPDEDQRILKVKITKAKKKDKKLLPKL